MHLITHFQFVVAFEYLSSHPNSHFLLSTLLFKMSSSLEKFQSTTKLADFNVGKSQPWVAIPSINESGSHLELKKRHEHRGLYGRASIIRV